jgi:hypothetical protein
MSCAQASQGKSRFDVYLVLKREHEMNILQAHTFLGLPERDKALIYEAQLLLRR